MRYIHLEFETAYDDHRADFHPIQVSEFCLNHSATGFDGNDYSFTYDNRRNNTGGG